MINNEQNNKKTTEGTKILQNYKLSDNIDEDILVDDNTKIDDGKIIKDIVIEKLMADLIKEKQDKENTVIFSVSLTKIEYELWEKQGGEKWLKKILLEQKQ